MTTNRHQYEPPTDIVQRIIDSPWPMVCVRWVDAEARGGPGWEDLEEMVEFAIRPPAHVQTVGLLVYETDDYVALTDTRSPDLTGGVQKIPKGWIIAIERLVADTRTNPLSTIKLESADQSARLPTHCRSRSATVLAPAACLSHICMRPFRAAAGTRMSAHQCQLQR